jgi:hypothetical protein
MSALALQDIPPNVQVARPHADACEFGCDLAFIQRPLPTQRSGYELNCTSFCLTSHRPPSILTHAGLGKDAVSGRAVEQQLFPHLTWKGLQREL